MEGNENCGDDDTAALEVKIADGDTELVAVVDGVLDCREDAEILVVAERAGVKEGTRLAVANPLGDTDMDDQALREILKVET